MSKMGKKCSKTSADEIQENIANKLSRMDSNNSANSSQDLHGKEPIDDEKTDKKKGRGASKLKMVSGKEKCKELERNELGQPIGDNSVKYAFFLGCMIKEFVPYTLDGWNDIDEEVKDKMWSCLQLTYRVEDWKKKSIFQKLAKLWRDRNFKLQILIREANTSRVTSRGLGLLKPEFIDQSHLDLFIKRTLSPTFQIWFMGEFCYISTDFDNKVELNQQIQRQKCIMFLWVDRVGNFGLIEFLWSM